MALIHSAASEVLKAQALASATRGDAPATVGAIDTALSLAPSDGEAYRMAAQYKPANQLDNLGKAAQFAPNTKNLRALARAKAASRDLVGATNVLKEALIRDPNNLPTLLLLVQLCDEQGDMDAMNKWGKRLLAVEAGPYFKVRALPELIPTETYEGRILLARRAPDSVAIKLEQEAIEGLALYARTTVPQIRGQVKAGGTEYAGETTQEAMKKLALGRAACEDLKRRLQRAGRPTDEVDALATVLAEPVFGEP